MQKWILTTIPSLRIIPKTLQSIFEPHFSTYYTKHLENVSLRICGFYWYIWGFMGWAMGEGCQPFESVVPVNQHMRRYVTFQSNKHCELNSYFHCVCNLSKDEGRTWEHLWIFCPFLFWNSSSSTVHTAPILPSTRTKHLWRLRLCRTAFWEKGWNICNQRISFLFIWDYSAWSYANSGTMWT